MLLLWFLFFTRIIGIQLSYSRLQGKCFIKWAITPAQELLSIQWSHESDSALDTLCYISDLLLNDKEPVTLNVFPPSRANNYVHLKFSHCLLIPPSFFGCWPLHARQVLDYWVIPSAPLQWLLLSLNSYLIVLPWRPDSLWEEERRKTYLCFPGWSWFGSGCVSGVNHFLLLWLSSLSLGHYLSFRGDLPGFLSQEGLVMDRRGRHLDSWQLTPALLCFVSQPVLVLSYSYLLASVFPGTALVSHRACKGRKKWKERTKGLCFPLQNTPTMLASFPLGSEVLLL